MFHEIHNAPVPPGAVPVQIMGNQSEYTAKDLLANYHELYPLVTLQPDSSTVGEAELDLM